jgi:hypothetical protein
LAALISWYAIINWDGEHPNFRCSRIGWERTYSLQNSLISNYADREGEARLMMPRFRRKLIVNTTEHNQNLVSRDCIPRHFRDDWVMIRREAALRDRLTGKDGISRFDGSLSIGVTNIVFDSHATFVTDRKDGRGCFWRYGECWQVPRIFDG